MFNNYIFKTIGRLTKWISCIVRIYFHKLSTNTPTIYDCTTLISNYIYIIFRICIMIITIKPLFRWIPWCIILIINSYMSKDIRIRICVTWATIYKYMINKCIILIINFSLKSNYIIIFITRKFMFCTVICCGSRR